MMRKNNKSVQFHAGEIQYASTDLLENSESDIKEENKAKFRTACKRQNIDKRSLIEFVDSFADTKLLVLGDTILDQYAGCEALGMSAEAPVVVVKELEQKNFIGGAALVAANVSALGAHCDVRDPGALPGVPPVDASRAQGARVGVREALPTFCVNSKYV